MKSLRIKTAWPGLPALVLLLGTLLAARADTTLTADELVQKAVARAQQSENRTDTPDFQYTKVTLTEELDGAGKVKERKQKVYDVAVRDGLPCAQLLEVNGRAPTTDDRRK